MKTVLLSWEKLALISWGTGSCSLFAYYTHNSKQLYFKKNSRHRLNAEHQLLNTKQNPLEKSSGKSSSKSKCQGSTNWCKTSSQHRGIIKGSSSSTEHRQHRAQAPPQNIGKEQHKLKTRSRSGKSSSNRKCQGITSRCKHSSQNRGIIKNSSSSTEHQDAAADEKAKAQLRQAKQK